MKLLNVSDYCFYRIYHFFLQRNNPVPQTCGAAILGIVEALTLFLVLALEQQFFYRFDFSDEESKFLAGMITIIALGLNAIRYESKSRVTQIIEYWRSEKKGQRTRRGTLLVIYFILICLSVFFSVT